MKKGQFKNTKIQAEKTEADGARFMESLTKELNERTQPEWLDIAKRLRPPNKGENLEGYTINQLIDYIVYNPSLPDIKERLAKKKKHDELIAEVRRITKRINN